MRIMRLLTKTIKTKRKTSNRSFSSFKKDTALTRKVTVLGAFFALAMSCCHGVEAAPSFRLQSPPKESTAQTPFHYRLILEWPSGEGSYEVAPVSPVLENLELIEQRQSQETAGSRLTVTLAFTFSGIKKGPARIGPLQIPYRREGETDWQMIPVPAQTISIRARFPWPMFLRVGGLILTVSLCLYLGRKAFVVSRAAKLEKNLQPYDPKQRVYAKSEEHILTFKGETQQETLSHWLRAVKETVMTYYGLPNKPTTESEIIQALASQKLRVEEMNEITRIFRETESLKFNGQLLTTREMETLQKTLLKYVRGKIIIEKSMV
jgi:hypothetical protein